MSGRGECDREAISYRSVIDIKIDTYCCSLGQDVANLRFEREQKSLLLVITDKVRVRSSKADSFYLVDSMCTVAVIHGSSQNCIQTNINKPEILRHIIVSASNRLS